MLTDSSSKRSIVWGGLLIVFGVIGLLNSITTVSVWVWVGASAVMGVGILAVYLTDTSEWWLLIPAYVLIGLAIFIGGIELGFLGDELTAPAILTLLAIPFLFVYLRDRSQWWMLIPGYVLLLIALFIGLVDTGFIPEAWTAPFVLAGIGLPFLVVYLLNRENWWGLIPAYVMFDIGLMVGLIDAGILRDLLIPAFVLLSIGLPFFVVYALNPSEWWPLIPGGIMGFMGVIFLMTGSLSGYIIPALIIAAGLLILGRQFASRNLGEGLSEEDEPETDG